LILVVASIAIASNSAQAWSVPNLQALTFGYGDTINNYDFLSEVAASNNVDWPVDILWWNNATVDYVKGSLNPWFMSEGGPEHFFLSDGANDGYQFRWDDDKGRKTGSNVCFGDTYHYRVYAPQPLGDHFYNPNFGYYVFGTTHRDHNESCNDYYNDSEVVEQYIWQIQHGGIYWSSLYDYAWFYNRVSGNAANHYWDSDGYATYIAMP
jgi:hypothetical protein